jgi:hypothetical protein
MAFAGVATAAAFGEASNVGAGEAAGVLCAAARGAAEPRLAAMRATGRAPAAAARARRVGLFIRRPPVLCYSSEVV